MAIYTVHAPRGVHAASGDAAERVVFVRDGFAWLALVFPLLWMLAHRMWLAFLGVLALSVALGLAGELLPRLGGAVMMVGFLMSLLIAFEANQLRRWSLGRKGYVQLGTVVADDIAAAERRFFEAWIAGGADSRGAAWPPPGAATPAAPHQAAAKREITGLFPEAGR